MLDIAFDGELRDHSLLILIAHCRLTLGVLHKKSNQVVPTHVTQCNLAWGAGLGKGENYEYALETWANLALEVERGGRRLFMVILASVPNLVNIMPECRL